MSDPASLLHAPVRPGWDCLGCGAPWPCDAALDAVALRFADDPLGLAAYVKLCYWDCLDDVIKNVDLVEHDVPSRVRDRLQSTLARIALTS
ncbi:hypothetical protein [Mangrovihabitans endophyticus]|uniref:Uncharacterized protein n=1 Tax=Mangrovihabitans endophyticus TaxID=1751298 RepID=A0A8J3C3L6_9ACTN|nr:hypothetical protein [Mangrovihabitans endophyticus]GGL05242.1 hypothetical protein GCM10012284_44680 [Mangrovihabitans endophyticus]